MADEEKVTEIATTVNEETAPLSVWTNKDQFNQCLRAADMLSKTSLIPTNYQGKPQDCFLAIEMASRIGVSPMMVMQNMYVVKGKPSWAGQACKTLVELSGKFREVKHVYTGEKGTDSRGCYLTAIRNSDGQRVDGTEITMKMAKAEGWTSNSKWRNMPEQMLGYRAAAFFARMHCPEALMGVQTAEENYEVVDNNKSSALNDALKGE